jgi:sugar O-acyltransferase (sialic acid O-acetyltransferase NeuD family)
MILFGASGHAKVILEIAYLLDIRVEFLLDDNPDITQFYALNVHRKSDQSLFGKKMIISIGDNKVRKKIASESTCEFETLIHPRSTISASASIGVGTVVMATAVINAETKIGKHCIINTSSIIDHDCSIQEFVHVSPNATLCGGVQIGEGTQVGASATIIPNIKVGRWSTIGAGAVVVSDVPDFAVVVGNPARIIKYNNV